MDLTDEGVKYPKKYSITMTEDDFSAMNRIAHDRGDGNLAGVFREAVSDYIRKNEHPEYLKDQIRQALREEPSLVEEAVQIYAARQLVKK